MHELVNFGHNPLLEAMLTFSTWKGGFSASDKQAMKDAFQTIRTAIVQPFGTNADAKRRNAKCIYSRRDGAFNGNHRTYCILQYK